MASKALIVSLVDLYYELEDAKQLALLTQETNVIIEITNAQLSADKILTNISKRWAMGDKRKYVRKIEDVDL